MFPTRSTGDSSRAEAEANQQIRALMERTRGRSLWPAEADEYRRHLERWTAATTTRDDVTAAA